MPFATNADLPDRFKKLPGEAQTIFRKAFNNSFERLGEVGAIKVGISAVKKVFQKNTQGEWVKREKIQALVRLDSKLQAFSQDEIIQKIPGNILAKIKANDKHPFFQMYSMCHEGISQPKIEGKPSKPIQWFRESVQSIKNVIKTGIKFFNGHNPQNSKQIKENELGELIHAFEEEIEGKLHHCVIGYFPQEKKAIAAEMDICSQEAEWNLTDAGNMFIAGACKAITGIALGKSGEDTPAFEGAKRLAFVQAFDIQGEGNSPNKREGDSHMTYDDILKASNRDVVQKLVNDLQLHPNQLFDLKGIQEDREFGQYFEELNTTKQSLQAKEKELEEFKTKNKELDRSIKLNSAKGKLSDIYKDLQLTDNMQKFVDDIYDERKGTLEDLTDDGLKSFVEDQKRIFQKATGVQDKKDELNLPTGDGKDGEIENPDDASKAENNPFLDEDYNPDDYS